MSSARPPVTLCLTCSASLSPGKASANVHRTSCCSRPICPNCLFANPRLARYNPCLRCLAGVKAVSSRSPTASSNTGAPSRVNVDGSFRDEDVFVIDDEDDSESDAADERGPRIEGSVLSEPDSERPPPRTPDYSASVASDSHSMKSEDASAPDPEVNVQNTPGQPPKYFIRPHDTLLGISLRLGIDSRVLCRLNGLPPSTLRTTPHLLHTRAFLVLPASIRAPPPLSAEEQALDEERKVRLAVERAETRFQTLTKEIDRAVAKAYVALAGLPDRVEELELSGDIKEYGKGNGKDNELRKRRVRVGDETTGEDSASLEGRALDQYLDDADWEAREHVEGRKVAIPSFPLAGSSRTVEKMATGEQKPWWRWRH